LPGKRRLVAAAGRSNQMGNLGNLGNLDMMLTGRYWTRDAVQRCGGPYTTCRTPSLRGQEGVSLGPGGGAVSGEGGHGLHGSHRAVRSWPGLARLAGGCQPQVTCVTSINHDAPAATAARRARLGRQPRRWFGWPCAGHCMRGAGGCVARCALGAWQGKAGLCAHG